MLEAAAFPTIFNPLKGIVQFLINRPFVIKRLFLLRDHVLLEAAAFPTIFILMRGIVQFLINRSFLIKRLFMFRGHCLLEAAAAIFNPLKGTVQF